jgi:hypothetical protein
MFDSKSPELFTEKTIGHNAIQVHFLDDDFSFGRLIMLSYINDFNR